VNKPSVSRYGGVVKTLTSYFANTANALSMATAIVKYWGTPQYRVESIEFDGYGLTDWTNILSAELGDEVYATRKPVYNSTQTNYFSRIESLNHDITASSWRVTMNLSPVPL
jgi:hypothetical protein